MDFVEFKNSLELNIQQLQTLPTEKPKSSISFLEGAQIAGKIYQFMLDLAPIALEPELEDFNYSLSKSEIFIIKSKLQYLEDVYLDGLASKVVSSSDESSWVEICVIRTCAQIFNDLFGRQLDATLNQDELKKIDCALDQRRAQEYIDDEDIPQRSPKSHWWWCSQQ